MIGQFLIGIAWIQSSSWQVTIIDKRVPHILDIFAWDKCLKIHSKSFFLHNFQQWSANYCPVHRCLSISLSQTLQWPFWCVPMSFSIQRDNPECTTVSGSGVAILCLNAIFQVCSSSTSCSSLPSKAVATSPCFKSSFASKDIMSWSPWSFQWSIAFPRSLIKGL